MPCVLRLVTRTPGSEAPPELKNLCMPLFLRKGCFPEDFREGKRPIKAFGDTAH